MSIDRLEKFEVNGLSHWALVRGRQANSPVLLLLQAGPGLPMIHEASALERVLALESVFRVVYWDQRGCGRSLEPQAEGPLKLDQLVVDTLTMAEALCRHLEVERVHLCGFSIGGTTATLAAARDPRRIASVTAVGMDVDMAESEAWAYSFATLEAERRGCGRAQRQLEVIGPPPHTDPKRFLTRVKWISNFGGVHRRATFGSMVRDNVWRLLMSPHYSLRQVTAALRAIGETQRRLLADLQDLDLVARAPRLEVPLAVFQGRHDVAAVPAAAERYFRLVGAPRKRMVWFEESAHMPHVEEPGLFRSALLEVVASAGEQFVAPAESANGNQGGHS